jgi:hypothetical protein
MTIKGVTMKHTFIRYILIVLLVGLGTLADDRAYAQETVRHLELQSFSWGLARGQTAHINVMMGDGSVRFVKPAITRVQLLDTEGAVMAQSDEIRVSPGEIRFWDVPRESLSAVGEPGTARLQLRARIFVTLETSELNDEAVPLAFTLELVDSETGRASVIWLKFRARQAFPGD